MSSPVAVDIFVEDRTHEEFLVPMVLRIAREESVTISPRVRAARGGHGTAVTELELYQHFVLKGVTGTTVPDVLIAGIDGNCSNFARKKKEIEDAILAPFSGRLVVACPDPHVERWYLADPDSFCQVLGVRPRVTKRKCERGLYKRELADAVKRGGHRPTLGGIEFAAELVERMDLYRAGKNERSLKAFVDDLRSSLRTLPRVVRAI